jgi:tetratricopeptide (TPR) repeat protein
MTDASTKTIFISHATVENDFADQAAEALRKADFDSWVDHQGGLEPGSPNWDAALRAALVDCDAVLFVMSPRSLASEICTAECLLAKDLKKPIYVAYLETVKPEEIWTFIRMIQYADLRTDFDAGMQSIIRVLKGDPSEIRPDDPTPFRGKVTGIEVLDANLPYRKTVPMTGRDTDLAKIREMLGQHVTQITAVGGTGKSRVAAETALSYPSGAIWHRCSETSNAYEVLELIRQHVGLDEKATEKQLLDAIESAPPLVVIDNAEDVPTTEQGRRAAYVDLMSRLNSHKAPVLLTSRVAWHELKPRREHPLEPLEEIDTAAKIASEFAEAEGVKLDDPAALATAAFLHPRLIEFAVRQLHERDLRQVLRQLRELNHEDVEEALTEMIHKTVEQMRAQAKNGDTAANLLQRLTVFRGSFDYDAALALKPDAISEDDLDDALVTLQRWGFVRRDTTTNRYRIDEVVIGALPANEEASRQHFDYYNGLHGDYDKNQDETNHPQIEADWQNLRTALAWGLNQNDDLAKAAVDFVIALDYVMQFRVSKIEQKDWLERAYPVTENLDDQLRQAQVLQRLGNVASMQADYPQALTYYQDAQRAFTDIGSRLGQAQVLQSLGDVARMQNDYPQALTYYQDAQRAFTDIGSRLGQAQVLKSLGNVASMQADYPQALTYYQDAQRAFTDIGERLGQAQVLQSLGDVASMQKQFEEGRSYYQQALRAAREIGELVTQLNSLRQWGNLERDAGNIQRACELYKQAEVLAQTNPFYSNDSVTRHYRGVMADVGCDDLNTSEAS